MKGRHDPKAAEHLIEKVIKNPKLRDRLKDKARQEEEEFQRRQTGSRQDSETADNFPI